MIAGNSGGDVIGLVNSYGSMYNLIGDGSQAYGISNGSNGNQVGTSSNPINAKLGILANNGGPTQTVALLAGSPALDGGSGAATTDTDQRGVSRGHYLDIGAYQATASQLAVAGFPSPTSPGASHQFTVSAVDTFDQLSLDFDGSVTFSSSDPLASLPTGQSLVAGQGTFNATLNTPGVQSITASSGGLVGSQTGITVTGTPATASFLEKDATTQGSWKNVYGSQGYNVINSGVGYPSYATVTPAGNMSDTWAASTSVSQALQDAPPGKSRIAACWYSSNSFTVDVDLTDGQSHNLELYLLDYDSTARSEQIVFTDANSHAVLSTQSVSSFHTGVYMNYTISGNVLITFTKTGGANAVLSGLFFDPLASTTTTGVSSSLNPSTSGQSVIFTATVSDTSGGVPTGSVEFYDGSTDLGPGSALSGSGNSASSTLTTSILTAGSHSISAVYTPTGNFAGSSGSLTQTVNAPSATATFDGKDSTTEGSWIGVYGSQGYNIINSGVSYPSYATVTPAGNTSDTWAASTSVTQALQDAPPGTSRIAACWYSSNSFTVDVDLTDGQSHNLELYLLDYDSTARSEQIVFTDANTHAVLSTQSVSSFHAGVYMNYTISGNVLITFTKTGGANAVLSGLFFDPLASTTTTGVSSSLNPSTSGQSVTFTATVSDTSGGVPTGSVEFYDGSTDLGPGSALSGSGNSATSTLTTSTLTAGSHSISAVYTPTGNFAGSSGSLTQTVNAPSATATFDGKDSTTEGSWIGVYGSQGYNVINSGVSYPSYATVTPAGNTPYTWAASTSVTQALQRCSAGKEPDRGVLVFEHQLHGGRGPDRRPVAQSGALPFGL